MDRAQPELDWLSQNETERMDANVPGIWDAARQQAHLDRYAFAARHCVGRRVADIACGTGYGSALLAHVAKGVVGIDICPQAIDYARRHYGTAEFRQGSADATGLIAGSQDVVVSFETLEHVPDDVAAVAEFLRVIGPKGCVVGSVPHLWTDPNIPHHLRVYDRMRLANLLHRFSKVEWFAQTLAGIEPCDDDNVGAAEWLLFVACRC
jgi:2-polyprenyl-3-methyl-5-hydroxy-6-metoxy-1,4-benzoquinol methylase